MSNDDRVEMLEWIDAFNRRGQFGRRNEADRKIVERDTVAEWAKSMKAAFGVQIEDIASYDSDPPDCIARINGTTVKIELAEFVDSERINARVKAVDAGDEPPEFSGDTFIRAQWTEDRFKLHLNTLINKKNTKYQKAGRKFDILLVHSDETWLMPNDVRNWMSRGGCHPRSSFKSAYLLLTYDPSQPSSWPIFKLFGELPSCSVEGM